MLSIPRYYSPTPSTDDVFRGKKKRRSSKKRKSSRKKRKSSRKR